MEQHRTSPAAPGGAFPPSSPARPPRSCAEYRWTPPKAHAFIAALARHGKVAAAARAVGMTRQSAYRLRERIPGLADAWAQARAVGRKRRLAGAKATLSAMQVDGSLAHGDTFGNAR